MLIQKAATCVMSSLLILITIVGQATFADANKNVEYVVVINIDALHADAIKALGPALAPNYWRFRTEGAFTDNARTEFENTVTTPNQTTILTGRHIAAPNGHLWGENSGDPLSLAPTLHHAHTFSPLKSEYDYVASVFDVVHDNGMRTALYYQKSRLNLHEQSFNSFYGAVDTTGINNGTDKIDSSLRMGGRGLQLTQQWVADMQARPFQYSYVHFSITDYYGHQFSWSLDPFSLYQEAVMKTDTWIGLIFELITTDPRFKGKTAVLLSTDHGGAIGEYLHNRVKDIDNYRIPFYAWGPGVLAGGDLYTMNPQYTDPGTGRPDYSDASNQPIRNGDINNLALDLLGLPPIPGSQMNVDQSLTVMPSTISPCGKPTYSPAQDAGVFLWLDCTDNTWKMRVAAGGGKTRYAGSFVSSQSFASISPFRLETNDVLDTNTAGIIAFNVQNWLQYEDGFNFRLGENSDACFSLNADTSPVNPTVHVGASETIINPPFSLTSFSPCDIPSPDGKPLYNPSLEKGVFLWRKNGTWHIAATSGTGNATYTGNIVTDQSFINVTPVLLENHDTLDESRSSDRIDFTLQMVSGWNDGFHFSFPEGANVCFTLTSSGPVLVGNNKTPWNYSFRLPDLEPCSLPLN